MNRPDTKSAAGWVSVHQCPGCGHAVELAAMNLRAVTSGIITCASCGRFGSIEIKIVDRSVLAADAVGKQ